MNILVKKYLADATVPTRARPGDSGLDLYAAEWVSIDPGQRRSVTTGIAIELPPGYEAQVRPRSGMTLAHGVVAALGTIDNGYRGTILVTLFNLSGSTFHVHRGDRIAQLVVAPVAYPVVVEADSLSDTERGPSGFGSTGA